MVAFLNGKLSEFQSSQKHFRRLLRQRPCCNHGQDQLQRFSQLVTAQISIKATPWLLY